MAGRRAGEEGGGEGGGQGRLSDVRGSHNGWYVDVSLVARLLGRSTHDILQSCEA